MKKIGIFWMALISLLFCVALSVSAQEGTTTQVLTQTTEPVPQRVEPQWGVQSNIGTHVSALTCAPLVSSTVYSWTGTGGVSRYCTSGSCYFECHVDIPTGAKITRIEIDGCDSTATGNIWANLARISYMGGSVTVVAHAESDSAGTPGCSYWQATPDDPEETVDNWDRTYWIEVGLTTNSTATTFSAVRVAYQLQVSPAPGTATFTDVPTSHPFFQYIEALAASGITTGYSDDTFRPSQYITRGQMAVFLAKALGLHWSY